MWGESASADNDKSGDADDDDGYVASTLDDYSDSWHQYFCCYICTYIYIRVCEQLLVRYVLVCSYIFMYLYFICICIYLCAYIHMCVCRIMFTLSEASTHACIHTYKQMRWLVAAAALTLKNGAGFSILNMHVCMYVHI